MGIGNLSPNWSSSSPLHQGEDNLRPVDVLVAGHGLEDGQVYLVASLRDDAGDHRGVQHKVFQVVFALGRDADWVRRDSLQEEWSIGIFTTGRGHS